MKKLLLQTLACCAILLPFSQVEAKSYGGFKPGKTFKLKVSKVISSKSVGTKIIKKAPIPSSIPKFKKGKVVRFKIGRKGQLTAKGLSIPYKDDAGTSNVYLFSKTGLKSKVDSGIVYKSRKGKPTGAALSFVRSSYKGFQTTTSTVNYTLKK